MAQYILVEIGQWKSLRNLSKMLVDMEWVNWGGYSSGNFS